MEQWREATNDRKEKSAVVEEEEEVEKGRRHYDQEFEVDHDKQMEEVQRTSSEEQEEYLRNSNRPQGPGDILIALRNHTGEIVVTTFDWPVNR